MTDARPAGDSGAAPERGPGLREPISTVTAVAYLAAGGVLYWRIPTPEAAVFGLALAALAVGTAAYHALKTEPSNDLDHAGMIAALLALATQAVGGAWWLMAIGAGAGGWVIAFRLDATAKAVRIVIGLLVWISLVAAFVAGAHGRLAASVAFLGTGFAAWHVEGDGWHGVWHILTAVGLGLLYLAVI